MVNDIGGEDLDAFFISELLGLRHDSYIECEDGGELLLMVVLILFRN